jgi:hypothetical protein
MSKRIAFLPAGKSYPRKAIQRAKGARRHVDNSRPAAAYRRRSSEKQKTQSFYAQENWHEPTGTGETRYVVQNPGCGYVHPATVDEIRERLAQLPERFMKDVEVVQLSRMTRKRTFFPCYGMQWGPNVYLYPIEESLFETYVRTPSPQQLIEAKMYGGEWTQHGNEWHLSWTPETIRDFYLNNVLIHEVGHVNDNRNTGYANRERYANWFAIEYGYRASRR